MADNPNFQISTASVSWVDSSGQAHIRVYSCDGYTVIERCNDGTTWYTGGFKQAGSAVSATGWYAADGEHLRVYCTMNDLTMEWLFVPSTGAWVAGGYTTQ